MKNLKRDNWTTEEVIGILRGCKLTKFPSYDDGIEVEHINDHNGAVQDCIDTFFDFQRPIEESGATAYDTEDKRIVHIGPILPR